MNDTLIEQIQADAAALDIKNNSTGDCFISF